MFSHCSCFQPDVEWILHHFRLVGGGCWMCPYPHGPIPEPTPNAPLSKGKLRHVVLGVANTPPALPWLVYWWIGDVWLVLHLEETREGEADPKERPSSTPGSVSPLPMCFPLLPASQSVLLFPQAHQQELLFFHNRIVHIRTSRDQAGADACTCQDE